MCPIPRGWFPNLHYEPSITFSEKQNNALVLLHSSKTKFPQFRPTCSPAPGLVLWLGQDRCCTEAERGILRDATQPPPASSLPRHHLLSYMLGRSFSPFLMTLGAMSWGELCKCHPATCTFRKAKDGYTHSQCGVKANGERSYPSWRRLMMDSSEMFWRKLRKHFERPPKREQIGPTLQQKGIFFASLSDSASLLWPAAAWKIQSYFSEEFTWTSFMALIS